MISTIGLGVLAPYLSFTALVNEVPIDTPILASQGGDDFFAVVDSSPNRITIVDSASTVSGFVDPGPHPDQADNVHDLVVSRLGLVAAINQEWDAQGFFVNQDEINVYQTNGNLVAQLAVEDYTDVLDPTLVQRGRFLKLELDGNSLSWWKQSNDGLYHYSFDLDRIYDFAQAQQEAAASGNDNGLAEIGPELLGFLPYDESLFWISDITSNNDKFWLLLQNGTVVARQGYNGEDRVVFNGESESPRIIPWKLYWDGSRQSLLTLDLQGRRLLALGESGYQEIFSEELGGQFLLNNEEAWWPVFYDFDVSQDGGISISSEFGVFTVSPRGELQFVDSLERSLDFRLRQIFALISASLGILSFLLLSWYVFDTVLERTIPIFVLRAGGLAILVLVVGIIAAVLILPELTGQLSNQVKDRILNNLQELPQVVDGDLFHEIDGQDDFGNEAYRDIRNSLLRAFDTSVDDWNRGFYFALYRIENEQLYGFMYMNGRINMYHPFDWLGGPEDPYEYDIAAACGYEVVEVTDIAGSFLYGVGPMYDSSGEVVALLEVGTELNAFQEANRRLITNLSLELLTFLVVVVLLVIELTHLGQQSSKSKHWKTEIIENFSPTQFARSMVFFLFFLVSSSAAFLPILAARLAEASGAASVDLFSALPLSLETLGFGIATLVGGVLARRFGWLSLYYLGIVVIISGLALSGTTADIYLFTAARAITGLGSGIGYMGLRSMINREPDGEKRSDSFAGFYAGLTAGINGGIIVGASLADGLGYQNIILGSAALMVILLLLPSMVQAPAIMAKYLPRVPRNSDTRKGLSALAPLVKSPNAWLVLVLMILPTYLAGAYLVYYFPLWAEGQGIATGDIGRLLMIHGLGVVLFGPWLTKGISKRMGSLWGSVLGSFLWALALLLAVFSPSLLGVALAITIMGLSEGFAVNAQKDLFLSLPGARQSGEDEATGYFELFGKFGETLGPILFAAFLTLGATMGFTILAAVVALPALIVPVVLDRTRRLG